MMNHGLDSLRSNEWSSVFLDGFRWQEEQAMKLFDALAENTSCTTVFFQNATLNANIDAAFTKAMIQNKTLRVVNLRNLSSSQGVFYPIPCSMFSQHTTIETLNLVQVRLDTQGCRSLSKLLQESASFRSLSLEDMVVDAEGFTYLLEGLASARSLTTLKLGKLKWTKADIQRFLKAISLNKTITKLSLENMKLDAAHATDIAMLLQKNSSVEQLSLRRNSFDHAALELLFSRGLNQTLNKLFLSRNPLGNSSAALISNLLTTNKTLQEICLVDTKMNSQACIEIARALKFNTSLRVLSFSENNLEECGEAILESLQEQNMSLHHIIGRFPESLTWKQIDFYLRANQANRRFLRLHESIQRQHLPRLLHGAAGQPDVLLHFIRSSGNHLFETAATKPAASPKKLRRVTTSLLLSKLKDMTKPPMISRAAFTPRYFVPPSA